MDTQRIVRSAGVVGFWTMVSRLLGLTRDILMAGVFATTLPMSAFVVAFMVPNLFRRLFGEGALSSAFIPVFVETRSHEGDAAAWRLAGRMIRLLAGILVAITLVLLAVASLWLAWGALGEKAAMILSLLRIMLPYLVFICLAALCMAILNSFHHFAVPAATPALLNLVWIAALLLIVPRVGETGAEKIVVIAWAVLAAGVVQLTVQIPVLVRYGFRPRAGGGRADEKVRRVLLLMGPATLGLAVTQINVVIDKLLAAWVGPWAPAALFFSERLIYFPLGIFATALGTVLLPVMSGHAADRSLDRTLATFRHALRTLMFLMIPASVGLLVLARPIVQMIFEWKAFGEASTSQTTIALQFYAPGLLLFSLNKVLVPVFYAHQDTRTPVRIGLYSVGINLALNVLFVLTWPPMMKHAGLACATVLAAAANSAMLAAVLHRRYGSPGWRSIGAGALRVLAAAAVMGAVAVLLQRGLAGWGAGGGLPVKLRQVAAVAGAVGGAAGAYLLLARLLGCPELEDLRQVLRRRRG